MNSLDRVIIYGSVFAEMYGYSTTIPTIPYFLEYHNESKDQLANIYAGMNAAYIVGVFGMGWILNKFNYSLYSTLLIQSIINTAAFTWTMFVTNVGTLTAARSLTYIACQSAIANRLMYHNINHLQNKQKIHHEERLYDIIYELSRAAGMIIPAFFSLAFSNFDDFWYITNASSVLFMIIATLPILYKICIINDSNTLDNDDSDYHTIENSDRSFCQQIGRWFIVFICTTTRGSYRLIKTILIPAIIKERYNLSLTESCFVIGGYIVVAFLFNIFTGVVFNKSLFSKSPAIFTCTFILIGGTIGSVIESFDVYVFSIFIVIVLTFDRVVFPPIKSKTTKYLNKYLNTNYSSKDIVLYIIAMEYIGNLAAGYLVNYLLINHEQTWLMIYYTSTGIIMLGAIYIIMVRMKKERRISNILSFKV